MSLQMFLKLLIFSRSTCLEAQFQRRIGAQYLIIQQGFQSEHQSNKKPIICWPTLFLTYSTIWSVQRPGSGPSELDPSLVQHTARGSTVPSRHRLPTGWILAAQEVLTHFIL